MNQANCVQMRGANAIRRVCTIGYRLPLWVAGLALLGLAAQQPVVAQGATTRHQTVTTRPRPIYDPLGIRAGSFLLLPSLGLTETYDSNLFLTPSGNQDDFVTSLRPELRLASQWSNHALNLGAGIDAQVHADHSSEDENDFFLQGDGRVDVTRDANLFGGVSFHGLHEARGDPNSPAAAKTPVDYRLLLANAGGSYRLNRVGLKLTGDVATYAYANAVNATSGAAIVQNTRDRQEYRLTGRASYDIVPEYQAFLQGSVNNRNYDRLLGGFNRSSDGYEILLGTDLDLGGVVFGEVSVGYRRQSYNDARLSAINGATGGAALHWNLTRLTTINGFVRRSVEETTISPASGFFSTSGGLSVDHELRRNILLDSHVTASNQNYEGISRNDNVYEFGLGAEYLVNRYGRVGLAYTVARRNSNAAGSDYTDHQIALNARLQF